MDFHAPVEAHQAGSLPGDNCHSPSLKPGHRAVKEGYFLFLSTLIQYITGGQVVHGIYNNMKPSVRSWILSGVILS